MQNLSGTRSSSLLQKGALGKLVGQEFVRGERGCQLYTVRKSEGEKELTLE